MSASDVPNRVLFPAAALAGAVVVVGAWQLKGEDAAAGPASGVEAVKGDLVISIRGVGRIVQADQGLLTAAPTSGSTSSGAAPTDIVGVAVYPRIGGQIARLFVKPGQHVAPGKPLALVDDGGVAAAAVAQAEIEREIAETELRLKRTVDPTRGIPATPAELVAARAGVVTAKSRLARLQAPPRAADVSVARSDVKRALTDLETLRGGTPAARGDAIRLAESGLRLAEERLARLLAPPAKADIAVAQTELKRAEAEVAAIQRPNVTPAPEALVAAQQAIALARADLAGAMLASDLGLIQAAHARLNTALNDLAVLLRPGPGALPVQVAAASASVDAAKLKLGRMLEPPNQADVTAARTEVNRARAELRARRAGPSATSVAAAEQAVKTARVKLAQLLGSPPASDLAAARQEVRRAEAELAVLAARGGPASPLDVSLAKLRLDAAEARLAAARAARARLIVRTFAGGTVVSVTTVRGAHVDPATPVVAVANLDRLAANVELSEFDAAKVRAGLKAAVSVDALGGKVLAGKVLSAALAGRSTGGGLVTFPVRVTLPRAANLKPGMNVSVQIVVARRPGVVQVPIEAVTEDDQGRSIVRLVDDESPEGTIRRVTVGLADNKHVEIVDGLRAGERVVLAEPASVEEG